MRERKLRSTAESLVRLKGSLIPYTYSIYKIQRKVKRKNTMRICSLSVPRLKDEWNQTVWSVDNLRCGTAEERAREKAKSEGKDSKEAKPEPKAQYNFTDPESRIMKGSDGFVQGYNTQVAVEPLFQLVVGQTVTQAANDKEQMVPLIKAIQEQS